MVTLYLGCGGLPVLAAVELREDLGDLCRVLLVHLAPPRARRAHEALLGSPEVKETCLKSNILFIKYLHLKQEIKSGRVADLICRFMIFNLVAPKYFNKMNDCWSLPQQCKVLFQSTHQVAFFLWVNFRIRTVLSCTKSLFYFKPHETIVLRISAFFGVPAGWRPACPRTSWRRPPSRRWQSSAWHCDKLW